MAELNGKTIHKELELKTPTGSNWRKKEVTEGALMVQADHGPIAIRKLRVKTASIRKQVFLQNMQADCPAPCPLPCQPCHRLLPSKALDVTVLV